MKKLLSIVFIMFTITLLSGCGVEKQSASLMEKILKNDIEFLLESHCPLMNELYAKMKGQLLQPKTVVCYDREAFCYKPGNVRITMDRNLRTMGNIHDFFFYEYDTNANV